MHVAMSECSMYMLRMNSICLRALCVHLAIISAELKSGRMLLSAFGGLLGLGFCACEKL